MASPPPPQGQQMQPSPQQIAAMQAQLAAEAQKRGMTPQQFQAEQRAQLEAAAKKAGVSFEEYINQLKQQAFQNHQRQLAAKQEAAASGTSAPPQQGQQVPINPGAPDPRAIAVAQWLRGQDLKTRTCILNGQRKDMFKIKRALRAIESPLYTKAASKKGSLLPPLTAEFPSHEILKLLPLSLLALRVTKADAHEGHSHAPAKPTKHTKGLWTVRIEQQQDISPELHYVFLYDGPQWRMKLYAGGALAAVFTVVLFPLWPIQLRIGVWYLSMGMLGLIALFFAMAIFRLILFVATMFTVPPGLWLYPNLFEDVGFFDSFRPLWGWQEDKKAAKKSKKVSKKGKSKPHDHDHDHDHGHGGETEDVTTSAGQALSAPLTTGREEESPVRLRRDLTPRVEEVDDE